MSDPSLSCRLYAVLARDGRSAVVFRRGPSKAVCLLRWWLDSDTIVEGQWLRGRIYERRSDLSPDGELLCYAAARHRGSPATWTAVSRPPYLTALALWAGRGTWGGGGLFESALSLGLNLRHQSLHAGFRLPRGFRVTPVAEWAGHGEDHPIAHVRMVRDGWRCVSEGQRGDYKGEGPYRWRYTEPEIYERAQPRRRHRASVADGGEIVLRRELHAIGVTDGPWLLEDFVVAMQGREVRRFTPCDWADWQSAYSGEAGH